MANVRNGNTFYINQQHISAGDAFSAKNVKVSYLIVASNTANAVLVLADNTTTATIKKIEVRILADETTEFFDFSAKPVIFPNGIKVLTLTGATATCVLEEAGG